MSDRSAAVIVDAVRTAAGRSHPERGVWRNVRGDDLAAGCVAALVERSGVDPSRIEDLALGCTQQSGEHGLNVARIVGLAAGLPVEVAGVSLNRLCGSSLQAIMQAAHAIAAGCGDFHLAGGFEHMQRLPMGQSVDPNPRLFTRTSSFALEMGATVEFLARQRSISRQDADAWALRSHHCAASAAEAGEFEREIVPLDGQDEAGRRISVARDQTIRGDTSAEKLAALPPAFTPEGNLTAGNSSPLTDGAAAVLLTRHEIAAAEFADRPRYRLRASAVAGVEPALMGLGPVPATRKALARAGLQLGDIDLIELNEAFAAQTLACLRELELDEERVNLRGGGIALGHPLGASGARIVTTLCHTMTDRDAALGLATMCVGLGQGVAVILERV